jgi:hypothetical protein
MDDGGAVHEGSRPTVVPMVQVSGAFWSIRDERQQPGKP